MTVTQYMSKLLVGHLLPRLKVVGLDTSALSADVLQLVVAVPAYFHQVSTSGLHNGGRAVCPGDLQCDSIIVHCICGVCH